MDHAEQDGSESTIAAADDIAGISLGEPAQTPDAYAYCLSYADMLSVPEPATHDILTGRRPPITEDGPSCP